MSKQRYARVLYEFTAVGDYELSVKAGDILIIVEDHEDGWTTCCHVTSTEQNGFVPTSYIEEINDYKPVSDSILPPAPNITTALQNGSGEPLTPPITSNIKKKKKEPRPNAPRLKYSENDAKARLRKQMKLYFIKYKLRQHCRSNEFKQGRQRNELIRELVETERTYVKHLNNFVKLVYLPMKNSPKKIIKDENFKTLFSNVEQILGINSMLLNDMEKALSSFPESKIGAVMLNIAPFFKTYTTYVNNYDSAFELYETLMKKKPKFKEFLSEQVYTNPSTERYKFETYLILPVQRIPRYKMLIEDILKNTPENHVEYQDLKKAVDMIKDIASFVNEGKRQNENSTVLLELSKALKDRYKTLVQPNRKYVREAFLNVKCPERGINNDLYRVCMFSDVLILCEDKSSSMFLRTKRSVYFLFFAFSKVVTQSEPTEFCLECLNGGEICHFTFMFSSAEDAKQWRSDAEDIINNIQKNNELKNIGDSSMIGKERVDLSNEAKQTLKKCNDIIQDFKQNEQNLLRLDSELRKDLEELRKLQEKIAKEKQEISNAEALLDQLEAKQRQETIVLVNQFEKIRSKDDVLYYALKEESDAFKQIFGEDISSQEIHQRLTPSPVVRQKRISVDQITFDINLGMASNRMTLPPPKKLIPPNKPPPPVPGKPSPPAKPKPLPNPNSPLSSPSSGNARRASVGIFTSSSSSSSSPYDVKGNNKPSSLSAEKIKPGITFGATNQLGAADKTKTGLTIQTAFADKYKPTPISTDKAKETFVPKAPPKPPSGAVPLGLQVAAKKTGNVDDMRKKFGAK